MTKKLRAASSQCSEITAKTMIEEMKQKNVDVKKIEQKFAYTDETNFFVLWSFVNFLTCLLEIYIFICITSMNYFFRDAGQDSGSFNDCSDMFYDPSALPSPAPLEPKESDESI